MKLEAQTSNPLIKISDDCQELILELNKIQPKLHKRLTANVKQKQLRYILGQTVNLFGPEIADPVP